MKAIQVLLGAACCVASAMAAEYYTELDRRLDSAFPTLRKQGRGTGSVVAPAGSVPASKSSRTVTIESG